MVHYFDPPTPNIQERYFDNGIQCHLALLLRTCKLNITDNSSPWLTFLIDWVGGGGSKYYGIVF